MKAIAKKSSTTTPATQAANQPFFAKSGSGGFFAQAIQAKMTVNKPGDKFEQEADRVAEQVMRMPEPQVQRQACSSPDCKEEDEPIQTKPLAGQITPLVQRETEPEEDEDNKILQTKSVDSSESAQTVDNPLIQSVLSSSGQPLDAATRSFMEPRFGQDFSGVGVHTDGQAAESARALQAKAYTYGSDIVFDSGEYSPDTHEGKMLLAHELTHVVQQGHSPEIASSSLPKIQRYSWNEFVEDAESVGHSVVEGTRAAGRAKWMVVPEQPIWPRRYRFYWVDSETMSKTMPG